MHASCQEMFKHSIPPQRTIDLFHPPHPPPLDLTDSLLNMMSGTGRKDKVLEWASNCRINITFRFFRPDFRPSATPKCRCGIPCLLRPDMKNRYPSSDPNTGADVGSTTRKYSIAKYWWTCNAGAQNQGKGCGLWQVMDAKAEGRGPFAGNLFESIL